MMTQEYAPSTLTQNAIDIYQRRYYDRDESHDQLLHRVADGNDDYIRLMAQSRFLPNSPALMNAGLNNNCTSSACFVFDIQDSMFGPGSITETRNKAIAVAKAGGGVGYYGGFLRAKNKPIKSIHRKACGPVAVLRDYHMISHLITQGGRRDLAQMFVLDCDHDDILEFVHCKDKDPQGLGSFNISVGWKDEWVSRVDRTYQEVQARGGQNKETALWAEQCVSAWHHGCPGMFFPDTVNRSNINLHLGRMNAPNPCGETPNRSDEPCSLGSLNLWRYVNLKTRTIDYGALEDDARVALRFMDNILDRNVFPHPDIDRVARSTRRLGLGCMGWADLLALQGIHYGSLEALRLVGKVWGLVNEVTLNESVKLGHEKGPYTGYDATKTEGPFCRNETRTSIAPTGTISILANASSGLEPHYLLEWGRTTKEGMKLQERIAVADYLDGFTPKTANEIGWEWHVRMQAEFQKYTDLGVSKTVNLPNSATVQDVSDAYKLMYELGCKGGTIFRDGCRDEQVLTATSRTSSVFSVQQAVVIAEPVRKQRMPTDRSSVTHKFHVGGLAGYLTVGLYDDHRPGEIFLRVNKMGTTLGGMLDAWAMNFSVALQNHTPLSDLCKHHIGTIFEPCGMTSNPDIRTCTSIPDYVCRWLLRRFSGADLSPDQDPATGSQVETDVGFGVAKDEPEPVKHESGMYCPDCGAEAIRQSGCWTCINLCGWSKC